MYLLMVLLVVRTRSVVQRYDERDRPIWTSRTKIVRSIVHMAARTGSKSIVLYANMQAGPVMARYRRYLCPRAG